MMEALEDRVRSLNDVAFDSWFCEDSCDHAVELKRDESGAWLGSDRTCKGKVWYGVCVGRGKLAVELRSYHEGADGFGG